MNMGLNVGSNSLDILKNVQDKANMYLGQLNNGKQISIDDSSPDSVRVFNSAEIRERIETKIKNLGESIGPELAAEIKAINNVMNKFTDIVAFVRNTDLTPEDGIKLHAEAQGILQTVSNIFINGEVDHEAILTGSNVEHDGSANTSYVLKKERHDYIDFGNGHSIDKALVPENFRNVIGALQLLSIEGLSISISGPDKLSDNALNLWGKANSDLTDMFIVAKGNDERLQTIVEESNFAIAEMLDVKEKETKADFVEISQKLSDAKNQSEVIQAIIAMMSVTVKEAIDTARAISAR